jgi:hypothetical protein
MNKKYTYTVPSDSIITFDDSGVISKRFKIDMKEFKKLNIQ